MYLAGNQIENIDSLKNLGNLVVLDLSGNQISSLSSLRNLANLESLGLNDNTTLKLDEIRKLQKALPNCEIIHNIQD